MRSVILPLALAVAACGGSPATPTPPTPREWTLAGSLVDVITNDPVRGATISFAGHSPVTTSDNGGWSLRGTGTSDSRLTASIEAPGYLKRETGISWSLSGRTGIRLDVIPERAPFSLAYFRALVRNGHEKPESLEPLRRWTKTPNFYVTATNPRTGEPLTAAEIDTIERVIREAVPQLTAGRFPAGAIEFGSEARERRTDVINIAFVYEPSGDYCGNARVGANPGEITMNYERCLTPCGRFPPETLAHEVGHAMGYWHTDGTGIMNPIRPNRSQRCGNLLFSPDEQLHAHVAYSRSPGNLDVDLDPASYSAILAPGDGPLVVCRR